MNGQLYIEKRFSEKKQKSYTCAVLKLGDQECFINLDRYNLYLLSGCKTPKEFESVEVGFKSTPINFEF